MLSFKRVIGAGVLIAALSVAVVLPALSPARTHYKVHVTIHYGADSFLRGKVKSTKGRCKSHTRVVVRRPNGKYIGKTISAGNGQWKLERVGLTGLVHAQVPRVGWSFESGNSYVCDKAKSKDIATVDV